MKRLQNQLPQVAFSILLALSLKPRHGYEIIKQIQEDSEDKIKLGPGALYTSIKQLREGGLIEEVEEGEVVRRRSYRLTQEGLHMLDREIEYYKLAINLAQQRKIVNIGD